MTEQTADMSVTKAAAVLSRLKEELQRVVIGQDEVVEQIITALLAGGHVLLEGVPGLGKTLLARSLAKLLGGDFARIQFTPDLMPADITGHTLYDMKEQRFRLRRGPVFTNLLLADEINRAPAKTQSALLEVMQEGQVTIEGRSLQVGHPFMVLATQNPIEQDGTYPLPEAELDRFMFKLFLNYPVPGDEAQMVKQVASSAGQDDYLAECKPVLKPAHILALQQRVRDITLDDAVVDYLVKLVTTTRDWMGIQRGAGPRASLCLATAARAKAIMAGRDFVIPDDVKAIALPVLRHRVLLDADQQIAGVSADHLLQELLDKTAAPRQ